MHSFTYSLFVASAATFLCPQVFATSADPIAVETVQQQFVNAQIVPGAVPIFSPVGLLALNFNASVGVTTVGEVISQGNVTVQPALSTAGAFNGTADKYTVLMIDANYVGSTNPNGLNLHWLQNDATLGSDGTVTASSAAVIPYAGPAPASGTGPHRYTVLFYVQPSTFTAPATPKANSGVNLFNLAQYVTAANLGAPLAGTYFTVEVGTATVQVGPTTAVNPASLTAGSTATVPGGKVPTGTGSATGSGSTSTSTTKPNGANRNTITVGGALFSIFGAVVLLF